MELNFSRNASRASLFTGAFVALLGCTSGEGTGGAGGATSSSTTGASMTTSGSTTASSTSASSTSASSTSTGGPDTPTFGVTKIGDPLWEPVDFHQASVDMGNMFENFQVVLSGTLPPPNHQDHPDLGVGPGMAHAGPYTGELGAGFAAKGYVDQKTFTKAEAWLPKAILLAYMVVPSAGAPMGSSPDGAMTPIIPNSIFPITVSVAGFQNGVMIPDFDYSFEVPPLDNTLSPPFAVDGHSHFPLYDATVMNDVPMYPGTIENRIHLEDATGDGYDLVATYVGVD